MWSLHSTAWVVDPCWARFRRSNRRDARIFTSSRKDYGIWVRLTEAKHVSVVSPTRMQRRSLDGDLELGLYIPSVLILELNFKLKTLIISLPTVREPTRGPRNLGGECYPAVSLWNLSVSKNTCSKQTTTLLHIAHESNFSQHFCTLDRSPLQPPVL